MKKFGRSPYLDSVQISIKEVRKWLIWGKNSTFEESDANSWLYGNLVVYL